MKNYKEKQVFLGYLNCDGEFPKIDITDPGYDRDVWCRINDVRVMPGRYKCFAIVGEWDETINGREYHEKRIMSAEIVHENFENEIFEWKELGTIGVDAGLAGFFISPKKDYSELEWSELCDWAFDKSIKHSETGEENEDCFLRDNGFFTTSGFGDGAYTVWHPILDFTVIPALYIEFINADDDII